MRPTDERVRFGLVLFVALAVGYGRTQDLSRTVTFRTEAVSVRLGLEELSKAAGVNLSCSPQTANHVLVVDVKDVPISALMDRIASATAAEWQRERTCFRLVLTPALRKAQERASLIRKTAAIAKAQEKSAAENSKLAPFDEQAARQYVREIEAFAGQSAAEQQDPNRWRRYAALTAKSPNRRLAQRVAISLDPASIAPLREGDRAVFSTAPNRLQRALPRAALKAIGQFAEDFRRLARVVEEVYGSQLPDNLQGLVYSQARPGSGSDATVAKVIVSVRSFGLAGNFGLRLIAADSKGRILAEDYANLNGEFGGGAASLSQAEKPTSVEPDIEVSELSRQFIEAIRPAMGRRAVDVGAPGPIIQRLMYPERFEPLGFLSSDLLLGIAGQRKLNLVASPDDSLALYAAYSIAQGKVKPSELVRIFEGPMMVSRVEQRDGWFLLKPLDAVEWRNRQMSRPAFGKLARSANSKKRLARDDVAAYALSAPGTEFDFLAILLAAIVAGVSPGDFPLGNLDAHRFHGSLNSAQREWLADGGSLPIGRLLPDQRRHLEKLIYGESDIATEYTGQSKQTEEDAWTMPFAFTIRELTEAFPDGLPASGSVSSTVSREDAILCSGFHDSYPTRQTMGVLGAAQHVMAKERPQDYQWMQGYSWTEFQAVRQETIHYKLRLHPKMSRSFELKDSSRDGSKVKSLEELPASLWKQIQ